MGCINTLQSQGICVSTVFFLFLFYLETKVEKKMGKQKVE